MLYSALILKGLEGAGTGRRVSGCHSPLSLELCSLQSGQELLWGWSRRRYEEGGPASLSSSLGMLTIAPLA